MYTYPASITLSPYPFYRASTTASESTSWPWWSTTWWSRTPSHVYVCIYVHIHAMHLYLTYIFRASTTASGSTWLRWWSTTWWSRAPSRSSSSTTSPRARSTCRSPPRSSAASPQDAPPLDARSSAAKRLRCPACALLSLYIYYIYIICVCVCIYIYAYLYIIYIYIYIYMLRLWMRAHRRRDSRDARNVCFCFYIYII